MKTITIGNFVGFEITTIQEVVKAHGQSTSCAKGSYNLADRLLYRSESVRNEK